MIAYLAELWKCGNQQPLRALVEGLDLPAISATTELRPKLEYKNIDLALLDGERLVLLIEMKVDDAEGNKKLRNNDKLAFKNMSLETKRQYFKDYQVDTEYLRQTELYTLRELLPRVDQPQGMPPCVFLTLGTGEWRSTFTSSGDVWKWRGLEKFLNALQGIDLPNDELFRQWKCALTKEQQLRDNCWVVEDDAQSDSGDRKGLLPTMRLGSLRSHLLSRDLGSDIYQPTVYKGGPAPDTILNLISPHDGLPGGFRYCEINNNGQLNFKIYFYRGKLSAADKVQQIRRYQEDLQRYFPDEKLTLKKIGASNGKSRTVGRLPIGLEKNNLRAKPGETVTSIAENLAKILRQTTPIFETNSTQ